MASRPLLHLVVAVFTGAALGVACSAADHLGGPLSWLGNMGWPWLATAFLMGSSVRNRALGALLGTVSLVAAVISYYAVKFLLDYGMTLEGIIADGIPSFVAIWVVVAAVGGPVFGSAGASWRGSQRTLRLASVAMLAGALAGECWFWLVRDTGTSDNALVVAGVIVAALLPVRLLRLGERWLALALTAGFACFCLAALAALGVIVRAGAS